MDTRISITAAYAFFPIKEDDLSGLQSTLKEFGDARNMKGLVLLAAEGINSTVCGSEEDILEWKQRLRTLAPNIVFKDSAAERYVFRRWSVKIKKEIVTIKKSAIRPHGTHRHVSPEQWHDMLQKDDVVVVDTRNTYETALGKFQKALDPGIKHFSEFPQFVEKSGIPKDKTVMMYCTGGIRCEKAIYAMEEQGYQNVVQLEGGILAYLEKYPHGAFEGECFVFDKRVSVDANLKPSQIYSLCPECGDPCVKTEGICAICK